MIQKLINTIIYIISNPAIHARWLNTLSYLEYCGAKKIAQHLPSKQVSLDLLQHAAEEFRHAYLLKKQIAKISSEPIHDYSKTTLIGNDHAIHYLNRLDLEISRLLKNNVIDQNMFKYSAYILVTFAIETRASTLYPIYQNILEQHQFNINLKPLIAEEDRHLEEMRTGIEKLNLPPTIIHKACQIEERLFQEFLNHLI